MWKAIRAGPLYRQVGRQVGIFETATTEASRTGETTDVAVLV